MNTPVIKMKSKTKLLSALIVVSVVLAVSTTQLAVAQNYDTSDTSDVSVNITATTEVTISPGTFNFTDMGIRETKFPDTDNYTLTIENTGSTNLTNIDARLDTLQAENSNPLGTPNAENYAAGRFLWIKNYTSDFYHAGSLSWNITEDAGGKPSGVTNDDGTVAWGFYRNVTGNYLWALNNSGTDGSGNPLCNDTGTQVLMKNETDDGSNRDLSASTVTYDVGSTGYNWSTVRANNGPLKGHYITISKNCNKFYIYRFDSRSDFPGSGSSDQYLVDLLSPGEYHYGRVGMAIPSGIPAGQANTTTLTVTASAS